MNNRLVELVESFHATESFGTYHTRYKVTDADVRALEILRSTIKNVGRRFEIELLWKEPTVQLPNNRSQAIQRFFSVEKRLLQDEKTAEMYTKVIVKYINNGHAQLVPHHELDVPYGEIWYPPPIMSQTQTNQAN